MKTLKYRGRPNRRAKKAEQRKENRRKKEAAIRATRHARTLKAMKAYERRFGCVSLKRPPLDFIEVKRRPEDTSGRDVDPWWAFVAANVDTIGTTYRAHLKGDHERCAGQCEKVERLFKEYDAWLEETYIPKWSYGSGEHNEAQTPRKRVRPLDMIMDDEERARIEALDVHQRSEFERAVAETGETRKGPVN